MYLLNKNISKDIKRQRERIDKIGLSKIHNLSPKQDIYKLQCFKGDVFEQQKSFHVLHGLKVATWINPILQVSFEFKQINLRTAISY